MEKQNLKQQIMELSRDFSDKEKRERMKQLIHHFLQHGKQDNVHTI